MAVRPRGFEYLKHHNIAIFRDINQVQIRLHGFL